MDSSRRRLVAWTVICFLIGAIGIVAAAHIVGTVPVSDGVSLQAPDGMNATLTGSTDALLENPFPTSGTVEWTTEQGNITFFSSGAAAATVHVSEINGTWTNITAIDADPNTITINPSDKPSFVVGNEITHISVRDTLGADDGTIDFVYGGNTGQSRVTLQGYPANTKLFAVDANTNTILDYATSDGSGQVTFDALDNSDHPVLVTTDENNAPTLSNPSPTGNVDSPPTTITIDVNDTDFSQGDSVTAELFVDGTSQGTDTLTSNGTASISFNADLGQTYNYYWNASDSFGEYTNSSTFSFTTPSNLTIRQETNASQIVTGANVTLTFYATDASIVVERTDSNDDGNISLTGLPDKEFIAVVEAGGYYQRRVYIESIYQQQNIFILNETEVPGGDAVNTTFLFEDRTGDFDPESTSLRIQRALDVNNDGTYEWLTVAGDFWGAASEFPFTGQENARYRLVVENADGDRRVLGTHIPVADGTKTIINGEIRFRAGNATGRYFDANLSQSANNIQILYQDPANTTNDIRVQIWELGNRSNEIHDQNYTASPYGRLLTTISLTDAQADGSWVVKLDSTTTDGATVDLRLTVGGVGLPLPADPWLLAAFSIVGITFIGTLYGPRTATLGAWSLVIAAIGMTAFGFIAIPYSGLVIATVIAAAGTFYKEALP